MTDRSRSSRRALLEVTLRGRLSSKFSPSPAGQPHSVSSRQVLFWDEGRSIPLAQLFGGSAMEEVPSFPFASCLFALAVVLLERPDSRPSRLPS